MQDLKMIFERALHNDSRVIIIYEGADGFTERKIRVISFDDASVSAYCYLRRQKRKFLFKNILSAQICEAK